MGVVTNEIKIAGIEANFAGIMNSISSLATAVNGKVDKVEGKGLSENDFTNADKTKLNNSETKYIAGNSINMASAMGFGFVTSSKKSLTLFIPLSKEISGTASINITSLTVRGDNEYVLNGANIMDDTTYTLGNVHVRSNGIDISISKKDDSAFNVVNNNSPVVAYIGPGTITIS